MHTITPKTASESLDPTDWDELRALGHEMVDTLLEQLRSVRERPVWRPTTAEQRARLDQPLPVEPQGSEGAWADFRRDVATHALGNVHPRFWGWVCGTGSPSAALYDMLASGLNASLGGFDTAPILVEQRVLAWLKQIVRFPASASGLLVTGGSMANLIGLAVARHVHSGGEVRKLGVQGVARRMCVYASSETHSSIQRALEMLGLGSDSLRVIAIDGEYRIDIAALRCTLEADRAAGLHPIAIVGNAGTVNTGAIDDLDALANLAREQGLWFHVDAAIGGPAMLAGEIVPLLKGLERADSLAFDLHKWMYVPYEAGCVLVRDAAAHRAAFTLTPAYLASFERGVLANAPFMADFGPELSRGFRALKIWMLLKEHGTARFGRLIARNVAQARFLADSIDREPLLERLNAPTLNIVGLRYVGDRSRGRDLDALNKELLMRLQESGIAVPSSTVLRGHFALRVCIVNHRTQDEDLQLFVDECVRLGNQLAREGKFDGSTQ